MDGLVGLMLFNNKYIYFELIVADDVPKYRQPLGQRFTGKGMGNLAGVRLEDINGDVSNHHPRPCILVQVGGTPGNTMTQGRADWLWVDNNGATTTYTNSRSCRRGKEGDRLNIAWRQGLRKGASSGPTHPGIQGLDGPVRDNIHFARI
jgi:hypothetical protein